MPKVYNDSRLYCNAFLDGQQLEIMLYSANVLALNCDLNIEDKQHLVSKKWYREHLQCVSRNTFSSSWRSLYWGAQVKNLTSCVSGTYWQVDAWPKDHRTKFKHHGHQVTYSFTLKTKRGLLCVKQIASLQRLFLIQTTLGLVDLKIACMLWYMLCSMIQ